ncbi:MAG: pentapeptide repeat-containing protein [Candidatus Nomurabacteria bacterium]|jgi:uncharacterized protein YjbI with pentapeptide repeats/DNA-binding XRE family transcriptional regulator|nr:pentapeptide repeat-containing protein [Candidatus Nomurabacteria bacterium]
MISSIEIGEKIAVARKLKNLSQTDVAGRMALSTQAIGKWERGESIPDVVTFIKLAEVLEVDLNYFTGDENSINQTGEGAQNLNNKCDDGDDERFGIDEEIKKTWRGKDFDDRKYRQKIRQKYARNMSGGNWENADFSGLKNIGEKFSGANVRRVQFVGSDLSKLVMRGNNIQNCDFSHANLSASDFIGCNIQDCEFAGADLSESAHSGSNIQRCNFTGANFTNTIFRGCNFEKAIVKDVVWKSAVFYHSHLGKLEINGEMSDCSFDGWKPKNVTFRDANLRNVFFKNCNLKKLQFENVCADSLTLAFLKSSKANVSDVKLIK